MSARYAHHVTEKAKAEAHLDRLTRQLIRTAKLIEKWREVRDRAQGNIERLEAEADRRGNSAIASTLDDPAPEVDHVP